jgi:hypothetical protein
MTMGGKKKMGRPCYPPGMVRCKQRIIRITPDELKALQRAARAEGLPLSAFIRRCALRAVGLEG